MDRCFPFLQGSFIPYNMPVYPGALRVANSTSESREYYLGLLIP